MKIRIGISAGGDDLGPEAMVALGRAVSDHGFDSLWLPEVLSRPGPDPLVGLAWASGSCPGLKIGTTMLLPGRNLVWLAKAIATLGPALGWALPSHLRARPRHRRGAHARSASPRRSGAP